jgi:hypothetical protein
LRSVAMPDMPDYDLFPAVFADGNVAANSASIVVPIVNVTIAPIVVGAIIITTFALAVDAVAAVWSDT